MSDPVPGGYRPSQDPPGPPDPRWAPPQPGTSVPNSATPLWVPSTTAPVPAPPVWIPPQVVAEPPALPVVPTWYHHFFRAPRYRWWRSLVALLLVAPLLFVTSLLAAIPAIAYEVLTGSRPFESAASGELTVTPPIFAANNVALALMIPASMLAAWACFGQRPKWLSSVTGGVRWRFLLKCVAVCLVPYSLLTAVEVVAGIGDMHWGPWSLFLIVTILLTTPFQAAGEEYSLRGLTNRAVAAWVPNRLGGALLGGLVSSLIFMALHGAGDVWLNIFYFAFGAVACRLAYATGGLEAPIALHVVNNLSAEVSLPFIDISGMFDRGAGTASAVAILPQLIVVSIAWGLMEVIGRGVARRGPVTDRVDGHVGIAGQVGGVGAPGPGAGVGAAWAP